MNYRLMKSLFLVLCSIFFCAPAFTQNAPPLSDEMRAALMKLIESNGELAQFKLAPQMLIGALKPTAPNLPAEFWDKEQKKIDDGLKGLFDKLLPLYAQYYTLEDVNNMIAFYETPSGKKMVASTAALTAEGFQIGQAWGVQAGADLRANVEAAKKKSE
jgi:uncharacterized protein